MENWKVRDDIGSYIRTVYHMVSHTPKRRVGGSNPLVDGQRGMISRNREIIPFFIGNV